MKRKYLHSTGQTAKKPAENRQTPFRNRLTPQMAIEALAKHAGQVSLAGESLGCSRGSIYSMMKRYPSVAKVARAAEERMCDVATIQMHKLVLEKDYRACAYWLDRSPIARLRGWGQGAEFDDAPRQIAEIVIKVIDAVDGRPVGQVIEHQAIKDNRAEDDVELIDVTPEDDETA